VNAVSVTAGFTVDVTTGMGVPTFALRTVRLSNGRSIDGVEVSTGNPHFVIVVDNANFTVDGQSWAAVGAEICVHPDFPHQTNVEFLRMVSSTEIEIRIFERGVGPTTSSGTGSSASATAALAFNNCLSPLTVAAPGGAQLVAWAGPGTELKLTGPAALIAEGEAFYK
jgi:diaminopimelate epimerase